MKNYLVKIIGADRKVIDFFNVEMTTEQVKAIEKEPEFIVELAK